jgi:hypothetical protein
MERPKGGKCPASSSLAYLAYGRPKGQYLLAAVFFSS